MANCYAFEAVNQTFEDIMDNPLPFGGKTMIFGGDFRKVLPVVKRGSMRDQIISRSSFWNSVKILHLLQNMKSAQDIEFSQFILRVGDGLKDHVHDKNYMVERAIITTKNVDVDEINEMLIIKFSREEKRITLKEGCPITILRNVAPELELCNGTRLICLNLGRNFIDADIITVPHKGTRYFLHQMPIKSEENSGLPFELTRRQYPVRLSFALTINKAQGQTIPNVGIFLHNHLFSHGQLYVTLSR
ncbi:uncharacterized protein [Henckelia pumila]|uniref:uncharacterized protein n=1 Tax=Henckelia pumila TaxID=405737 RepID=UPI003C6DD3B6